MCLYDVDAGKQYIVKAVLTNDDELNSFLFSLGCYEGQPVTVIAKRKGGLTVSIKDGRYSIDNALAKAIII
ncbi:MAG: ferrous iron transport protein A [Clostridia bacterium]|nr:ferrous iron transport protein A [Clostridia bacterium]